MKELSLIMEKTVQNCLGGFASMEEHRGHFTEDVAAIFCIAMEVTC